MTTLLAIDTSTEACSVALLYKGEKTHLFEIAQRTHTKRILPMVDDILTNSGIRIAQIDALVFGRGPGSFTGVRVAAGIAQGLALGTDIPAIGISNLTAMAQQAYEQNGSINVLSAIDARMNEVYFSHLMAEKVRLDSDEFIQWKEIIKEQVSSPEKVIQQLSACDKDWTTVGTGWSAYSQFALADLTLNSNITLPSAQYMLSIALPLYKQKQWISALEIEPVYLRNEVTWKKLPGRE
ncbi:tRNA threonylcarbamoyladenosine biosynthesis protein TsaB [Bisgaardia hudsonensis]|uniref:tRNA threonylcarbamoyladenosine biosynthesis protein TsaB n=1 Tax=Bisgaardia hudsonensis TaxID=109472 RepID=A0A4R2N128_9PAST|nr:tRNA (adenosine(37)-N6)-threonylcarbamoyltransferase complex dimerization subunit type 1 TsaB [Bisgaardia hudsonensis]QLB13171.1 tRNA N6-adenosine(37)-N6-threonylcarbamoyltransferase complex dimerization subunit TsaB [Bisgaardia hudsonensis]TCP13255.1 tRNA threonylcarbamoyladenosine biosynthesis protein TsaB [Bisgaardia hudsonensis]